jgi:hypothetical protein
MSVQVELLCGALLASVGIVDELILRTRRAKKKVQTSLFRAGGATVIMVRALAITSETVADATGLSRLGVVCLDAVSHNQLKTEASGGKRG